MGFVPWREGVCRTSCGPRVIIPTRGGPRVGFIPRREGSAGPCVGVITQAQGSIYRVRSRLSQDKNAGSSLVVTARRNEGKVVSSGQH